MVCVCVCVGLQQNLNYQSIIIHLYIGDDLIITPNEIVERIGARAEINCEYLPSPGTIINWGVGKRSVFQFIPPDNNANIIVSGDRGRTLIFDPVSQDQVGDYYCWIALTNEESVYSRLVPLTIFRKLLY